MLSGYLALVKHRRLVGPGFAFCTCPWALSKLRILNCVTMAKSMLSCTTH